MQPRPLTNESQPSLTGSLIGDKWFVEGELGSGGMGTVYSAIHKHNGRRVAIKVLNQLVAHNPEVRERFYQEAYAANLVVHPGTVAALDDGILDDGTPFLVMELLEGRDLEALFGEASGPLDECYVVSTIIELLSILEAAHEAGVLHRDIKPENIFCTSEGKVKLLDFGIAKVNDSQKTHRTEYGSIIGTPAYMPPEQARGRWDMVDTRSDLFSVGATMFTLLSGQQVHEGSTVNEVLLSAMTQRSSSLRSVAPHLSPSVVAVVDKALQFDQADRFSCATEMRHELIAALNSIVAINTRRETTKSAGKIAEHSVVSNPRTTHRPVVSSEVQAATSHSTRYRASAAILAALLAGGVAFSLFWDERPALSPTGVAVKTDTEEPRVTAQAPLVRSANTHAATNTHSATDAHADGPRTESPHLEEVRDDVRTPVMQSTRVIQPTPIIQPTPVIQKKSSSKDPAVSKSVTSSSKQPADTARVRTPVDTHFDPLSQRR